MVHFTENQESQLFDLGFEEEALQKALPPSAAHPFLFLAGVGGAGCSCSATVLVEDCGSFGCWAGQEDSLVSENQEANTSGVPPKVGSNVCLTGRMCHQCFFQAEKRA